MQQDFEFAFRTLREDIAALRVEMGDQLQSLRTTFHAHDTAIAMLQKSTHSPLDCDLRSQVDELIAERDMQRRIGRWVVALLAALITLIGVAFEGLNYWRR